MDSLRNMLNELAQYVKNSKTLEMIEETLEEMHLMSRAERPGDDLDDLHGNIKILEAARKVMEGMLDLNRITREEQERRRARDAPGS